MVGGFASERFIGRADELQQLVLVAGEAGVGKSRLLEEVHDPASARKLYTAARAQAASAGNQVKVLVRGLVAV